MNFFSRISLVTIFTMAMAILLMMYGYLCRMADLFIFWDSRTLGWSFFIIGFISFLVDNASIKKYHNKKYRLEVIGIVLLTIILIGKITFIYLVRQSPAYKAACDYVVNNKQIREEVGNYCGFTRFPIGFIQNSSNVEGVSATANFMMTVKGDRRYKDISVILFKYKDGENWVVQEIY